MKKLMLMVVAMFIGLAVFAGGVKLDATSLATIKGLIKDGKTAEITVFVANLDWSSGIGDKDWLPVAVATENYFWAQALANQAKDPVGVFTYGKKWALGKYLELSNLVLVMDIIGMQDFEGTAITPAMQLEFAKAVNKKYSRFLVTDEAAWKPFITALRTQIAETEKDVK